MEIAIINKDTINHLQTRLIGVGTLITQIEKLYQLCCIHPELRKNIPQFKELDKLFVQNTEEKHSKLTHLIQLLEAKTFSGTASFFSCAGRILAAHQLMKEMKDEFAPVLEALGTIEAHYSVAELLRNQNNSAASLVFVDFTKTNDHPSIKLENFWNPHLDPEKVVPNSIQLGSGTDIKSFILTGPNTGGKSTTVKGLAINLVLAHSLGIAAASEARLTPFEHIRTYLNISDDIAAGNSLFKAEVLRAKELLQTVQGLEKDQFCFVIMDEIFTGTGHEEGEKAAYQYAQKLTIHPQCIFGIATHMDKLTKLEAESPSVVNLHVPVIKQEDGSLFRPFKLERGKNTINIAFDLLKEENIFT